MLSKENIEFYQKISIELFFLFEKVNTIIETKNQNIERCIELSYEIDWIIIRLAQFSSKFDKKEPNYLGRLKEFNWSLLELLDEYCVNEFKISIW